MITGAGLVRGAGWQPTPEDGWEALVSMARWTTAFGDRC
jgi:hypothetical protein